MKKHRSSIYRITPFFLVLFLATLHSEAQSDSLAVVRAKWNTKKLSKGIWLKHYWFDKSLFGSSQNINILEIKLNGKNKIDVAAEPHGRKLTSDFGGEYEALAGINGTFFDMKNGGSVDYIRIDGEVVNETRVPKSNKRALHQKSAIIIDGKKVRVAQWDGSEKWEQQLPGEDVMVTGPLLVEDHQVAPMDTVPFYVRRHPRTAVALKGNRILFVTVDGRNEKAAGMSLQELAAFLKWMDAKEALNLDGGGSTTMWVKGFAEGGIINHPSDNPVMEQSKNFKPGMDLDNFPASEKWDRSGERTVANVLLVNKKK
jgi:exopolysaccharide biosynthesis protein